MFDHPLRKIGLLLLCCLAMGAAARADGPAAKFRLLEGETVTSPDRQMCVEQYATDLGDEGFLHQWLVRMQKLGAGYQTLFLYRRDHLRLTSATAKPLGDLAWDYFFSLPVSKRMHRNPKDRYSLGHAQAILLKGLEENYAWLEQHWPDSRYLVISLSFDVQGEEKPSPWIEGWRCLYDMKTGAFSVPSEFSRHNARAVKSPRSRRG